MAAAKPSKIEAAWTGLLDHHRRPLLRDGIATITAKEVKDITGEEPRLIMNIYTREQVPKVMKGYSVLPKTDKSYYIIRGDGYQDFEPVDGLDFHPPGDLKNILAIPSDGRYHNETQAVNAAYIASIIRTFTGEERLFPAGRGKGGRKYFSFWFQGDLKRYLLECKGVRIEIDDGFEGDRIYLVEAKLGSRSSFIIRQLYFPFLFWSLEGFRKEVVPLFITYSDKTFTIRQYEFEKVDEFHSIRLKRAANFSIASYEPLRTLAQILATTKRVKATPDGIPFPQANDLRKVIDFVDAVAVGLSTTADIAELFDFTERQSHYYGDAAAFLGLVEKEKGQGRYVLTPEGRRFSLADKQDRTEMLVRTLASLPVFREALEHYDDKGTTDRELIAEGVLEYDRSVNKESTAFRRAQSLERWIGWVANQYECESLF